MAKIWVTGANGFVGRTLVRKLLAEGHEVVSWVRDLHDPRNIALAGSRLFAVEDLSRLPDQIDFSGDVIVHLAGRVHQMDHSDPQALARYRLENVENSKGLLELAKRSGLKRLIYVSTAKVMGENSSRALRESDPPSPTDPYGISKFEAEKSLLENRGALDVVVLRPPLIYGSEVRENFLALIRAVRRGIPLPLASIQNRRSMIYVENFCEAIERVCRSQRVQSRAYFVCDDSEWSTPQLIRAVAQAMGRSARLCSFPTGLLRFGASLLGKSAVFNRLNDSFYLSSEDFRRDFGWQPRFSPAQGLKESVKGFGF